MPLLPNRSLSASSLASGLLHQLAPTYLANPDPCSTLTHTQAPQLLTHSCHLLPSSPQSPHGPRSHPRWHSGVSWAPTPKEQVRNGVKGENRSEHSDHTQTQDRQAHSPAACWHTTSTFYALDLPFPTLVPLQNHLDLFLPAFGSSHMHPRAGSAQSPSPLPRTTYLPHSEVSPYCNTMIGFTSLRPQQQENPVLCVWVQTSPLTLND